jgi:RHS repeat-associated protein
MPFEQINPDGTIYFLHHALNNNIELVTDTNGTVIAWYTYDPYGKRTSSTTYQDPFGYTGQYTDNETGLQYLRNRYYDPTTGQFLTRDPIAPLTRDPYGYAERSPLNVADPSGLAPWDAVTDFVGDRVGDVGGALDTATDYIVEHRKGIVQAFAVTATLAGVGVCAAASAGACAEAAAAAWLTRSASRVVSVGFSHSLGANLGDLAVTGSSLYFVSLPTAGALGETSIWGEPLSGAVMGDAPLWQQVALRGTSVLPDIGGAVGGWWFANQSQQCATSG